MSNVLIGIIGVILFIGLALAGALFLGPRFEESTQNSKAAAMVQALSQTANAASMYQLENGTQVMSGLVADSSLLSAGYLKANPHNTSLPGAAVFLYDDTGVLNTARTAAIVTMRIADSKTCEAIQRSTGMIGRQDPFDSAVRPNMNPADLKGTAGCVPFQTNRYWSYHKI